MTEMSRRTLLRDFLPSAAVATAGVTTVGWAFMPKVAEAVPSIVDTTNRMQIDDLVEKAQVVVHHHHHHHRSRRHRRRVCWWHRGRRVCGWR